MAKKQLYYEIVMGLLAVLSVMVIWVENSAWLIVDWIIWGIFVLDVTVRLLKSESKWAYLKEHPFDIIAIIPFDSIFRMARFARLFRIVRLLAILDRLPFFKVLKTIIYTPFLINMWLKPTKNPCPVRLCEEGSISFYEGGGIRVECEAWMDHLSKLFMLLPFWMGDPLLLPGLYAVGTPLSILLYLGEILPRERDHQGIYRSMNGGFMRGGNPYSWIGRRHEGLIEKPKTLFVIP